MNVRQLKEALDGFGDHLPVAIEDDNGEFMDVHPDGPDSQTIDGELYVTVPMGNAIEED